ncbi:glycoside hydrolase family 2 TIM barrel-domain containing protein [Amycolatopsis sp. NPDC051045]|uniref:glycoside hydrolase family 2 TIM barrel-domain containing protein n=1 Tax=Amycolatopsis sp. NPDC051045 TaxID=3156922 RepID=UPI00341EFFF2
MVVRDRNHASVVVWGTRVNEADGTTATYQRTGRLARQLDPSRPTSGALASATGARFAGGDVEVLAYNGYTGSSRRSCTRRPTTWPPPTTATAGCS